jgi:hypothetical protein
MFLVSLNCHDIIPGFHPLCLIPSILSVCGESFTLMEEVRVAGEEGDQDFRAWRQKVSPGGTSFCSISGHHVGADPIC